MTVVTTAHWDGTGCLRLGVVDLTCVWVRNMVSPRSPRELRRVLGYTVRNDVRAADLKSNYRQRPEGGSLSKQFQQAPLFGLRECPPMQQRSIVRKEEPR